MRFGMMKEKNKPEKRVKKVREQLSAFLTFCFFFQRIRGYYQKKQDFPRTKLPLSYNGKQMRVLSN